jgi:ACT domain-containing protein
MDSIKAIVTVVGRDQVGIIAGICNLLATENINVVEISQTVLDGFFNMMMVVDVSLCDTPFDKLQLALREYGAGRDLAIRMQREDIFNAMYEI